MLTRMGMHKKYINKSNHQMLLVKGWLSSLITRVLMIVVTHHSCPDDCRHSSLMSWWLSSLITRVLSDDNHQDTSDEWRQSSGHEWWVTTIIRTRVMMIVVTHHSCPDDCHHSSLSCPDDLSAKFTQAVIYTNVMITNGIKNICSFWHCATCIHISDQYVLALFINICSS